MALPETFIRELTEKNDIESVISAYVNIKRRGRNLVGLCPFHGEKTPSFTVYPETASFYCFGCGAGGDAITFIKKIENLDYLDAVKFLADRAGMRMPENTNENDAYSRLRVRVLEANRQAARFFNSYMMSPNGKAGLEYFHRKRRLSMSTITRFGLGYAPDSSHALYDELRKQGFTDAELEAAWLCKRWPESGRMYDLFRNRVMVPIIDIRGNVIAFGGRVLGDSKPKYLNSAETPVFRKSGTLFALNVAKATAASDGLILCEGYMDVIALHQAGFTNAVAALGTSFTEEHANLIARYAKKVTLLFDADEAGQKAASRAIDIMGKTGVDVRVMHVPDGKDPDEFLQNNPPERFQMLLEGASNDVEYRLVKVGKKHLLTTADGRAAYLQEAAAVLATLNSPIERDVYAGQLAQNLGVNKQSILKEIERNRGRVKRAEDKTRMTTVIRHSEAQVKQVNPEALKMPRAAAAEEGLLGLLILHPDYIRKAKDKLPPELMATEFNRRVYRQLLERNEKGLLVELSFLSADYTDEEMGYLSQIVRTAADRVVSDEELTNYITVLRDEQARGRGRDPSELSEQDMLAILNAMKESQQGGNR